MAEVEVYKITKCMRCGLCVAVCPTHSIDHPYFPVEKVHPIDTHQLPSPDQILLLIRSHHVNRAFIDEPVPDQMLDMVLEAAYQTSTASRQQRVELTLVTNHDILQRISAITVDTLFSKAKTATYPLIKQLVQKTNPSWYRSMRHIVTLKQLFENGQDKILKGASAVIFIHTRNNTRFGNQDCNLAYQTASLMAGSLGIGHFYTSFVCLGIKEDKKQRINHLLGIDGIIHAGMALGMPAFKFPNYIERNDVVVNKI